MSILIQEKKLAKVNQQKNNKQPVDEIVHYGGEEIKPGHKDEFDPNAPKGSQTTQPGKPGLKILIQAK